MYINYHYHYIYKVNAPRIILCSSVNFKTRQKSASTLQALDMPRLAICSFLWMVPWGLVEFQNSPEPVTFYFRVELSIWGDSMFDLNVGTCLQNYTVSYPSRWDIHLQHHEKVTRKLIRSYFVLVMKMLRKNVDQWRRYVLVRARGTGEPQLYETYIMDHITSCIRDP